MRWQKEGDVYRLIDSNDYTRAFVWFETRWRAVGPLGTGTPINELVANKKHELVRVIVAKLRQDGYK